MISKEPHPNGRKLNSSIAIFELDGCVSDNSWRIPRLEKDPKSYHDACTQDPSIEVGKYMVQAHIDQGDFVIFATARPFAVSEQTSKWIQDQFKILPFHDFTILMRRDGDERPELELKKEFGHFIKDLCQKESLSVSNAYDPNPEVVALYREFGYNASVLNKDGVQNQKAVANDVKFVDTPEAQSPPPQPTVINVGRAMARLFPNGVTLRSEQDYNEHLAFISTLAQMIKE